jgi:hypothetical protein
MVAPPAAAVMLPLIRPHQRRWGRNPPSKGSWHHPQLNGVGEALLLRRLSWDRHRGVWNEQVHGRRDQVRPAAPRRKAEN